MRLATFCYNTFLKLSKKWAVNSPDGWRYMLMENGLFFHGVLGGDPRATGHIQHPCRDIANAELHYITTEKYPGPGIQDYIFTRTVSCSGEVAYHRCWLLSGTWCQIADYEYEEAVNEHNRIDVQQDHLEGGRPLIP